MQSEKWPWRLFSAALVLVLAASACGGDEGSDEVVGATPIPQPALTSTPGTLPSTREAAEPSPVPNLVEAQVVRVVDGDTIEVLIGDVEYLVRYIGIDTPETKHPTRGVEPFGPEASEANRELVEGKTILLEKDVSETDRYGRLLRYVYVGNLMVNEELLRRGLARVATFPPDVKYVDRFLAIQREAQAAGIGIWGGESSAAEPTPTPVSSSTPSVGGWGYI